MLGEDESRDANWRPVCAEISSTMTRVCALSLSERRIENGNESDAFVAEPISEKNIELDFVGLPLSDATLIPSAAYTFFVDCQVLHFFETNASLDFFFLAINFSFQNIF